MRRTQDFFEDFNFMVIYNLPYLWISVQGLIVMKNSVWFSCFERKTEEINYQGSWFKHIWSVPVANCHTDRKINFCLL